MILIHRTFEIITPESSELGDVAESGFLSEDEPVGFREIVELLQGGEPSSWPCRGNTWDWVTHELGETRAFRERGESESHSVHFSRSNPPHAARYWRWAMRAAGVAS